MLDEKRKKEALAKQRGNAYKHGYAFDASIDRVQQTTTVQNNSVSNPTDHTETNNGTVPDVEKLSMMETVPICMFCQKPGHERRSYRWCAKNPKYLENIEKFGEEPPRKK